MTSLETLKSILSEEQWEQYVHNVQKQKGISIEDWAIDLRGKRGIVGLIDRPFTWDRTAQGHSYWSKLNSKVGELYNK